MNWRGYLAIALVAISFGSGFWLRGVMSDRDVAQRDAGDAKAVAENVTEVRKDDKASQADTAVVEQQHVEQQQQAATEFKYITREVIRYVASNPSPAGCGLDADGLRIWRQSSAGKAAAEPGGAAVSNGAVPR